MLIGLTFFPFLFLVVRLSLGVSHTHVPWWVVLNTLHFPMRWGTYWRHNKKGHQAGGRRVSGLVCPWRSLLYLTQCSPGDSLFLPPAGVSQSSVLSQSPGVHSSVVPGFFPLTSLPLASFTITAIWMKRVVFLIHHLPAPPPESCETHSGLPYCAFPWHTNPAFISKASLEKCPQLWAHHCRGNLFPDLC